MNKIMGQTGVSGYSRGWASLEASEIRYRRLFESAQDGILILDADTGKITDVNPFLIKMLGYSKEELLGKELWEIGTFKDIRASQKSFLELQTKKYVRYEDLPLKTKDGHFINVEFVSNVYLVNHHRVIQCNIRDITDRRRAEKLVLRSLKEKESLLRELHHRVKNNLQIITSLLQLKLGNSKNIEVINVFKQTQERIRVIALVHEKLCEGKDFMSIDISCYVRDLINSLLLAYGVDRGKITMKTNVTKVLLKMDIAVPCGLIINELLSNSFKYAFPGERRGKIILSLRLINKGTLEIKVSDDGIGFPKGFDLYKTKTVGLALVVSTIENQLGGKVKLNRVGGTHFRITFKI
ncbi:MAG: histidine kinase dimerization/phosphoacceptor domain -containing protein [Candidatus Omnitrophica bacterium]|nr:histidine kinase dimerization/phosphoacceptor domain -containing protein [Candidatus Omnitrophota bacterium]